MFLTFRRGKIVREDDFLKQKKSLCWWRINKLLNHWNVNYHTWCTTYSQKLNLSNISSRKNRTWRWFFVTKKSRRRWIKTITPTLDIHYVQHIHQQLNLCNISSRKHRRWRWRFFCNIKESRRRWRERHKELVLHEEEECLREEEEWWNK